MTSLELDDFDEYPEISATELDNAIHRRNFVEIQSLINAALRDVISHSS